MYYDINKYIKTRDLNLSWRSAGDRHFLEAIIGFDLEQTTCKDQKKHLTKAMKQLMKCSAKCRGIKTSTKRSHNT